MCPGVAAPSIAPSAQARKAPAAVPACTVCGSPRARELFAQIPYRYLRCADCGVAFVDGPDYFPKASVLYEHLYARFGGFDPLTERRYRARLSSLARYRRSNRLLDVGCGTGHFLAVAGSLGWQAEGTELSDAACALGERTGATVHRGELIALALPEGRYDVVSMLELIEHVGNPAAYLREAARLLRPGGGLLLSTPNFNGLTRRLIGPEWRVISPEHLHYFTRGSLTRALRSVGFGHFELSCVNWNPFDVLASRRFGWLSRRRQTTGPAMSPRAEEQQLRRRIYASPPLRLLKDLVNRVLSATGLGDALWTLAIKRDEARSS